MWNAKAACGFHLNDDVAYKTMHLLMVILTEEIQ